MFSWVLLWVSLTEFEYFMRLACRIFVMLFIGNLTRLSLSRNPLQTFLFYCSFTSAVFYIVNFREVWTVEEVIQKFQLLCSRILFILSIFRKSWQKVVKFATLWVISKLLPELHVFASLLINCISKLRSAISGMECGKIISGWMWIVEISGICGLHKCLWVRGIAQLFLPCLLSETDCDCPVKMDCYFGKFFNLSCYNLTLILYG